MGLITSALGGMGEGLEKGSNLAGGLYIKGDIEAQHAKMAQEAQALREERNIRLTGEQTRQTQAAVPRVIAPGATERIPGQPDFQAPAAPEKQLTPEQIDKLNAEAEYLRAHARAVVQNKEGKPTMPKLIVTEKDDQGNPTQWLDQNTGAIGNKVAGSPALPPVSHWFSANEPGKAAVPSGINWTDAAGQSLPGLHVYYPDMKKRGVETSEGPSAPAQLPDPLGLRSSLQKQPSAPATKPITPPARTTPAAVQSAPQPIQATPETGFGGAVDLARAKLANAQATLQSYGLQRRRSDPQGFAQAQAAVEAAQREVEASMAQYQNELGSIGAATRLPLRSK